MTHPASAPFRLGADVVQMLLPHRRPFLFVDGTLSLVRGPRPSLRAQKLVSANEPVFEGHFPGLSLWPGVYTIEGLGQTANILVVLLAMFEGFAREGLAEEEVMSALLGLEARTRGGRRAESSTETTLLARLGAPISRMAYAGAIDVKLIEPVYAGAVIEYRVTLTHVLANAKRFDVEACVSDRPVARGTTTIAIPSGSPAA